MSASTLELVDHQKQAYDLGIAIAQTCSAVIFLGVTCWFTSTTIEIFSVVRKLPLKKRLAACSAINIFVALFATACSLFQLTSSDDFVIAPEGFEVHLAMRVEWILTAPLMQLCLVIMGGERIPAKRRFLMPGLSVSAIGLGICGTLAPIVAARYACYGAGCLVLALLLYFNREQVLECTDSCDGLLIGNSEFRTATLTLVLTWCTFPIWCILSPEGFGVIDNALVIHAGWAFLNIVAKVSFTFFIQRCSELEKKESEKRLLREDYDVERKLRELNRDLEDILSQTGVGRSKIGVWFFDSSNITKKDELKFPTQFVDALRRLFAPDNGPERDCKMTIGGGIGLPGTIEAGDGVIDGGVLKHVEAYRVKDRDSEHCKAIQASSHEILAAIAGLDLAGLERRLSEVQQQQQEELKKLFCQISEKVEAGSRQVDEFSREEGLDSATEKLCDIAGMTSSAQQEALTTRTGVDRLETSFTMLQQLQEQVVERVASLGALVEDLASARRGADPVEDSREVETEISAMRADIAGALSEVRELLGAAQGETQASLESIRGEMQTSITSVQSQMSTLLEKVVREVGEAASLESIRGELESIRGEMQTSITGVQSQVSALVEKVVREVGEAASGIQQRDFDALRERLDEVLKSNETLANNQIAALETSCRVEQSVYRLGGERNLWQVPKQPPPVAAAP